MKPWKWTKMPSDWIQEQRLKTFGPNALGPSVAALKLYCAILIRSKGPWKDGPPRLSMSYSVLEGAACLSRALVSSGLDRLGSLIVTDRGSGQRASTYSIGGFPSRSGGWAKFPGEYFEAGKILRGFSTRSGLDLDALKLYFVLLAFRENRSGEATITYDKIGEYSGLRPRQISHARSKLISAELITLYSPRDPAGTSGGDFQQCNRYLIRGLKSPQNDDRLQQRLVAI